MRQMAQVKVQQVGTVSELTMDYVLNHSIEELIDEGHRFIIVNTSEDEVNKNGDFPIDT